MSSHIDNVPRWVRTTVGILALFTIMNGIGYYIDAGRLFALTNPLIKNTNYELAARELAIGLALGFVTIIRGAPEALTILTIVRALIEIQTIIFFVARGNIGATLITLSFLVLEIFMVKTLIGVIKKEEAE